ncbi:ribonuclease H-like domain-containing protein [Tanacetum coccineum]
MNQMNQRRDFSKSYSSVRRPFANSTAQMANSNAVMGSWGSAVKTSASYNWRTSRPNFNYSSGPTHIRTEKHPLKNMVDRGIFDSGCSGHMTGNKDQLEDFEEFNGGSVTFGELGHFNLFSISQICDKQHKVLFTETECLVVSSDFKMPDENQILLKVPRHHNMYSFDMKTPSPAKGFACLIAKATSDESKLWHRRLGHINFKNLNKLVKGNLVRGLPSRLIRQIENQLQHRVKIIISDNGTEFKNIDMLEFCGNKGIKQEYSTARTPQQNGVAERMNRTLIERLELCQQISLLPTTFWAEAVSTACYIFNRNQANPHAGDSEVTNNAGTPTSIASEEKDEEVELIVVPSAATLEHDIHIMPELEIFHKHETGIFDEASYDEEGVITDFNSLPTEIEVSPTPTLRIHNIHPKSQILGDPKSAVQTRSKVQNKSGAHAPSQGNLREICLKKALQNDSWVQAMQEELLQFKLQQVWVLVDLPHVMKVIGTKWVYKNKRDERGRQVKQNKEESPYPDKYVAEILKKFDLVNVKAAITPMETKLPLTKDEEAFDVDVHLEIFKYQGKPSLGLWYPRESPFDLEAFSDSDYGGSNLDRKSTTGGCQFLGQRLISWQCKKQTIVATSTTEAEYVAAANCCGQVLWVQNQLLDYGFQFMIPKILQSTLIMKALFALEELSIITF